MDDNFNRCKLCRQPSAHPAYRLNDSIVYACSECDFHFLNRLDTGPGSSEQVGVLSEEARQYIEMRADEGAHLHPNRLHLVEKLAQPSHSTLLDIGAGLGQFQLLAEEHGYKTSGIEPSSLRRQYALERFSLQLSGQLVDSDEWQNNYAGYFDLMTLWDVIEHVNFPLETLKASLKLLKPGGIILLDTPSRTVLPYRLSEMAYRLSFGKVSLFLPGFYSTSPFGHKQIFTPTQLTNLLQDLGLRIIHQAKSYTNTRKGDKIILAAIK